MKKRIQLSKNFYLDEFTRSIVATNHGIVVDIIPGSPLFCHVQRLVCDILQPLRDALGPVHISSGYRPEELNKRVGGAKYSQHLYALAADITVTGHTPMQVAQWIHDNISNYDQLVLDLGRWVHVSVALPGAGARTEVLTAYKSPRWWGKPKTHYLLGLLTQADAYNQLNQRKAA